MKIFSYCIFKNRREHYGIVVAESEEEARELMKDYSPGHSAKFDEIPIDKKGYTEITSEFLFD